MSVTVVAENSRGLRTKPIELDAGLEDAARIAQAIAQRMDPEWREFVDQEQRKRKSKRTPKRSVSLSPNPPIVAATRGRGDSYSPHLPVNLIR
jgi:hypothetical protein